MTDAVTPSYRSGSGETVVLLHGLNGSWRIWKPVIALLEGEFDVFAPTLPGHRGGPVAPATADVPALADLVERTLDEAGIDQAHLVGNSLGGWLALELAARGRATSVVVFSPAGTWQDARALARLARLMKVGRRFGGGRMAERTMRSPRLRRAAMRIASERADLIPADEVPGVLEDLRGCSALDGILAGIDRHGPMQLRVDLPVRLVWPDRDRTLPFERYGRPLVDLLPKAELVRAPGIGHVPMHDDPALVARSITEFLRRT